jgi:hypothetical protein
MSAMYVEGEVEVEAEARASSDDLRARAATTRKAPLTKQGSRRGRADVTSPTR